LSKDKKYGTLVELTTPKEIMKFKWIIYFLTSLFCSSLLAENPPPFCIWIKEIKKEARERGICEKTLTMAFKDIKSPLKIVLQLDRSQSESTSTLQDYLKKLKLLIPKGRENLKKYKKTLEKISKKYQVPAPYILALWGVETRYGSNKGNFNIIEALATLAHDGRRSAFFRQELLHALQILDEGHVHHKTFKGSWAGAMGHCQFMPSSFYLYAVDEDQDGKRDIWGSVEDAFASIANYLHQVGWKENEPWGYEVKVPTNFDWSLEGLSVKKPLEFWCSQGVHLTDGQDLPLSNQKKGIEVSLIKVGNPEIEQIKTFIVYENFKNILKWNKSKLFGLAVGHLADAIRK
jgi:membrane-bound lytic murein transglycosylase B